MSASDSNRRSFLGWLPRVGMASGLLAAYGTLAAFMARFLYPARPQPQGWMFVTDVEGLAPGESIAYQMPSGAKVNVARLGEGTTSSDFIALSSVCPHLGCQVHWEGFRDRFFCPCHNGVFDPQGVATAGPPAEAHQSLPRYPLRVEGNLLFVQVPVETRLAARGGLSRPGHDGCLEAGKTSRVA